MVGFFFFFQAEDGIRDRTVTGVQTCALPISTPVRTGIQTAQPGYEAPLHSHPYVEILHILDGAAEAWIEGREDEPIVLEQGDTLAIPPDTPHSFRVRGDRVLRLLGTHASSRRIVAYKDGA